MLTFFFSCSPHTFQLPEHFLVSLKVCGYFYHPTLTGPHFLLLPPSSFFFFFPATFSSSPISSSLQVMPIHIFSLPNKWISSHFFTHFHAYIIHSTCHIPLPQLLRKEWFLLGKWTNIAKFCWIKKKILCNQKATVSKLVEFKFYSWLKQFWASKLHNCY